MGILYTLAIFGLLFICALLCFIIMMQEGKGGGLGASFGGGADGGDSLFGTSTPEILKKVTAWLGIGFIFACVVLSFWTASMGRQMGQDAADTELVD